MEALCKALDFTPLEKGACMPPLFRQLSFVLLTSPANTIPLFVLPDTLQTVLDFYGEQAARFAKENGGQRPVLVFDGIEFLGIPGGGEDALWRVLITQAKVRRDISFRPFFLIQLCGAMCASMFRSSMGP